MDEWKQLIVAANMKYASERYPLALSLYQQALQHVLDIFDDQVNSDPDGTIAAVMVSYFNIADAYLVLREVDTASDQFDSAFQFLWQILKVEKLSGEVSNAAVKACGQVNMEWSGCIDKHGGEMTENFIQHYREAKRALNSVVILKSRIH